MATQSFNCSQSGSALKNQGYYHSFSTNVIRVGPGYGMANDYKGCIKLALSDFDFANNNVTKIRLRLAHTSDTSGSYNNATVTVGTQRIRIIADTVRESAGDINTDTSNGLGNISAITSIKSSNSNYWYEWDITPLKSIIQNNPTCWLLLWGLNTSSTSTDLHEYRGTGDTNGRIPHVILEYTEAPTTYTVTYGPGSYSSGSSYTDTKTKDVALTLRNATYSRVGYDQTGWSISEEGTSKSYNLNASYTSNANIALFPYWTIKNYLILYTPDEYTNESSGSLAHKTHGSSINIKGAIFTRNGYTQIAWKTLDGTRIYNFNEVYNIDAQLELFPVWQANGYIITYTPGSFSNESTVYTDTKIHDIDYTLKSSVYTRSGYTQTGWSIADNNIKAYELSDTYTNNLTITLYPYWSPNEYNIYYKPDSYSNENTPYTDIKYHDIAKNLREITYTRTGYTQDGWSTTAGGAKIYNLNESYTSNTSITLYPSWAGNNYTITYSPGAYGNGNTQTDNKIHGLNLTLKNAIFTRTGFYQLGWSTTDGGNKVYNLGGSYTANENKILYPYWAYKINYHPGVNGSGVGVETYITAGSTSTLRGALFNRNGYSQTGWATSDGGPKVYELNADYTDNTSIDLYPYWEEIEQKDLGTLYYAVGQNFNKCIAYYRLGMD